MHPNGPLPQYSRELSAFHAAHRPELRQILCDLKLRPDSQCLDVACGDGCYCQWIAELVGPNGLVVGIDLSNEYLNLAKQHRRCCKLVAGRSEALPFAPESFDLIWCAQSLISLPKLTAVLREMFRVLRRGGRAVILENDSLHELILPWPVDLELAIRSAQWRALRAAKKHPNKRYLGRRLVSVLRGLGFTNVSRRTYATDRIAPLEADELIFLTVHLTALLETVSPYLSPVHRRECDRLIKADSPQFLLGRPDFEMTWFDVVCVGYKR